MTKVWANTRPRYPDWHKTLRRWIAQRIEFLQFDCFASIILIISILATVRIVGGSAGQIWIVLLIGLAIWVFSAMICKFVSQFVDVGFWPWVSGLRYATWVLQDQNTGLGGMNTWISAPKDNHHFFIENTELGCLTFRPHWPDWWYLSITHSSQSSTNPLSLISFGIPPYPDAKIQLNWNQFFDPKLPAELDKTSRSEFVIDSPPFLNQYKSKTATVDVNCI